MKKTLLATLCLIASASTALAHPGHTHQVDGHTHTLVDLVFMGLAPVALILFVVAVIAAVRGHKS